MDIGLEYFEWLRSVNGYVWRAAKILNWGGRNQPDRNDKDEDRFLVPKVDDRLVSRYFPLKDHPTLYRTFSTLDGTDEAFLAFANEYGGLGVGIALDTTKKLPGKIVLGMPIVEGEPRWRWRQEHHMMRGVTAVLDAIQREDTETLGRWFQITETDARYENREKGSGLGWELIAKPSFQHKDWLWNWAMGAPTEQERLMRFAHGWAQKYVNDAMSGAGRNRQSFTSARVLFRDDRDEMRLHIVPNSLLAAMWLQCARVLVENPTFKTCEHCRKWFEVSADTRRRHSKYCSDRCKVAAYKARQSLKEKQKRPANKKR